MVFIINTYKFYDYNPDSDGELIATADFEFNNFKCDVKCLTNKTGGGALNRLNKRYECVYIRDNRKRTHISYDTYSGYDVKKIKKGISSTIEYCYNKNKRGRKAKFE